MSAVGEFGGKDDRDNDGSGDVDENIDPRFERFDFSVDDLVFLATAEGSPHGTILEKFSEVSEDYYGIIVEGVTNGNVEVISFKGEEGTRLYKAIELFVNVVQDLPKALQSEGISDERAAEVLQDLLIADDRRRTEVYSSLVADAGTMFAQLNPQDAKSTLNSIYAIVDGETNDEISEVRGSALLGVWANLLQGDITKLGRTLIDDRRQERMDRAVDVILDKHNSEEPKNVGRHALDITKIALGTAAGVLISGALRRRFRM